MDKPIQYLLVGLPYSGKTTLAKTLVEHKNFAHINIDQLKWDHGYAEVGDDDVPDHVWEEIFKEADGLIIKYLKEGKNLANEYAWITRAWRDRARNVAKELGFETKVIYINIPVEIVMSRRSSNAESKTRFQWPQKEMNALLKDFEPPTPDENILLYDQTLPVEDWINRNI